MRHATKLALPIELRYLADSTLTPFRDYARLQRYSKGLPGDYEGLAEKGWCAKNISVSNEDRFIEQLPIELLRLERPYVLYLELPAVDLANPVLPAHRDYGKKCSINIYLEASGEVTTFYHWDRDAQKSQYAEEFCAATGEVWLIDTDTPHSVSLKRNQARRLFSFCFAKLKYEEVLECFTKK